MLLAGDAAHTHSPIGAQGMNTGIGDGMNLGWKLAAELRGTAPRWLLDSYESERHPVGATVLRMTNVLTKAVLVKSDLLLKLVQLAMRVALSFEPIRRRPRGLLSGVGISYRPRGEKPHRLAGRRAPEVDVPGGRLYEALRDGRFLLVDRSPCSTAAGRAELGWGDRVSVRAATPPTGTGPLVMLVRPDAYVAWASDREPTEDEVDAVLTDWCGPALQASTLADGDRGAARRSERKNR